ncbi:MAG TPA: hypothetical protein VIK78_02395 [Ruminiclostridium sp.]
MLTVKFSHSQYQDFVHASLNRYFILSGQQVAIFTKSDLILKLWVADITGIAFLLKSRYSNSNKGDPPKDPVALFRSYPH